MIITIFLVIKKKKRLPWWLSGEESTCHCKRHRFESWIGKNPMEKEMATHSTNPLQYFCLGNPMDRGAWKAIVCGDSKSWT